MVLLTAAATMPASLVQQYDDDSAYSPAIVSSLAGINVASSGILNAVTIPRSKRQRGAENSGQTSTSVLV